MSDPRLIKKYPNRRLYDTAESRYVTIEDIRKLVVNRVDITVVAKRDGCDITQNILLQVILEQERSGTSVISRDVMLQAIRSSDATLRKTAARNALGA
jgi:polyhydroxyalkanoate synthesis repressor PhaR